MIRNSTVFLIFLASGLLFLTALVGVHPLVTRADAMARLQNAARLVERLGLTDLCLFTEASYTRHPSTADRFAPFQDHPRAMAHFPSGSLVRPPEHLLKDRFPEPVQGAEP